MKKTKKASPLKVSGKLQLIAPEPMVEIARSFSYKLNVGNYESRDFFASQKAQCKLEDAEKVSQALAEFCKQEVLRAVNQFKAGDKKKVEDVSKESAELDQ
jgi:hypothetical protein